MHPINLTLSAMSQNQNRTQGNITGIFPGGGMCFPYYVDMILMKSPQVRGRNPVIMKTMIS